jgi:hypothetical protein
MIAESHDNLKVGLIRGPRVPVVFAKIDRKRSPFQPRCQACGNLLRLNRRYKKAIVAYEFPVDEIFLHARRDHSGSQQDHVIGGSSIISRVSQAPIFGGQIVSHLEDPHFPPGSAFLRCLSRVSRFALSGAKSPSMLNHDLI